MLTFGSLFSGIGGMDLGLERAGLKCVWQVEIDSYAQKILQKHWPHVPRWDDVRTFPPEGWGAPAPDLICGGFPCQDISVQGLQAGITGSRSGLWTEFSRIVCTLRPRYILVENVANLVVEGIGTVLGDLANIRYDVQWDCLPAGFFGAPHLRKRIFLFGFDTDRSDERKRWKIETSWEKETQSFRAGSDSAHADSHLPQKRVYRPGREEPAFPRACWGTDKPGMDRASYGTPNRVDRIRCLGNAVVPQVAEWIGKRIIEALEP